LQEKDIYKTKPQLAIEIIHELIEMGFKFRLVLADSLYGESGDFIEALHQHQLLRGNILGTWEKLKMG
jgi:SRSO17 transposase